MIKVILLLFLSIQLQSQIIHQLEQSRFTHYAADDWVTYGYSNHITSIDIDLEIIYFGTTAGGILRYNFFNDEWLSPYTSSTGLPGNKIIDVVYDAESNDLYAETPTGNYKFNRVIDFWEYENGIVQLPRRRVVIDHKPNGKDFLPFSRPSINNWPDFFTDRDYELMLNGDIYDAYNDEFKVGDRLVDEWYRMWIGTNGTGIGIGNLNNYDLVFKKQSIAYIQPKDVFVNGDNIWIGGSPINDKSRGITKWDYNTDEWFYYKGGSDFNIFSDDIRSIHGIGKRLFFGSEQGLIEYNSKKDEWKSLRNIFELTGLEINDLTSLNNWLSFSCVSDFESRKAIDESIINFRRNQEL